MGCVCSKRVGSHQWWRNGSSHLDESEIWLKEGASSNYKQFTERGARQLWPMCSADGKTLYYVSDHNGKKNLWAHPVGGAPKQITRFTDGRMLWSSIGKQSIIFERDFSIWEYNIEKNDAKKLAIILRGAPATPPVERAWLSSGFSNLALSPDGKKMAFVAHGGMFVTTAKEGGEATRAITTTGVESQPVWAANSNILYYISKRGNAAHIYQYNFISYVK